jgi:hypothetical protein
LPTISWFYGISIRMFFNDHAPPHFHAIYEGREATFAIASGELIGGSLPPSARRLVREWLVRYRPELSANWDRARANQPLERIPGLGEEDE